MAGKGGALKGVLRRVGAFTAGEREPRHAPLSRGRLYRRFLAGAVAVAIVLLLMLQNQSVTVENVTVSVPGLPSDLEGYTLLVMSDLHGASFGTAQATLLRAINNAKYDLVLMAGDMVGRSGNAQPLYDLLDGMTANRAAYFIAGDSDPAPLVDVARETEGALEKFVLADWILGAMERGAVYVDSPEAVKVGGATLWITPDSQLCEDANSELARVNALMRDQTDDVLAGDQAAYDAIPFTTYRQQNLNELLSAVKTMKETDVHVSLSHYPTGDDYLRAIAANASLKSDGYPVYMAAPDLVLSGHYCGGLWKLPFYGAFYIPEPTAARHGWFPAQEQVEGLRYVGATAAYTGGGLGATDAIYLGFRLFNSPKITLIKLTAALTELR